MHAYALRMVLNKAMMEEFVKSSKEALKKEVI